MTTTHVTTFDRSLQVTKVWLREVGHELGGADEEQAFAAVRGVLQALRDRIPAAEATDFGAQLPLLLQGVYYHGWNPAKTPEKTRTAEAFLERVSRGAQPDMDPRAAVSAVTRVISRHVTSGEQREVQSNLPADVRALWSEPA